METTTEETKETKTDEFKPMELTCPHCNTNIITDVSYEAGYASWISCLICSYLGLVLGCCLIPFLHKRFKDSVHTCPICRQIVKRCSRLDRK